MRFPSSPTVNYDKTYTEIPDAQSTQTLNNATDYEITSGQVPPEIQVTRNDCIAHA